MLNSIINTIIENRMIEFKSIIFSRLDDIAQKRLHEAKLYLASELSENLKEQSEIISEAKQNANIVKMGRVTKIRRRIRRNSKGKIVVQRNIKKSGIKGYRLSGSTIKRIPAFERMKKARLLKRSWKTTRRSKLRRTLLKRKMSMRRRQSLGI